MVSKEINCAILKVYIEEEGRNGPVRTQIVKWGKYPPVLEKREYWKNDLEEEKTGKAKGFNAKDFQIILSNANEIKELLAQ